MDQLPDNPISEVQTAKKGKSFLKTVKVVADGGKQQKNEGPPSDSWSWRKYGQKPIKGSPYPRGYYRCSTSKGCPAKKQVERCRSDASMLVVTYTSTHNHPGPDLLIQNTLIQKLKPVSSLAAMHQKPKHQQSEQQEQARNSMDREDIGIGFGIDTDTDTAVGGHFHYLEPPHDVTSQIDHNPFSLELDSAYESLGVLFDEEPISFHPLQTSPKTESHEYGFFDELEELPLSSITFSSFYGDRIIVQPS